MADVESSNVFGSRRIYYNNFVEHLLNRFNPNMTHPDAPCRWSEKDWRGIMDMVADYGFNVWEFWLAPRIFCREGLDSEYGRQYVEQLHIAADQAHKRSMKVEMLCCLVTVGTDWHSYCPNCPEEWEEVRYLWKTWAEKLDFVDIFCLFPGDPGCCSRNGCTALTYIDKSIEISHLIKGVRPEAEIDFNTWGPPVFGWGIIEGPPGWKGEFLTDEQGSAWRFDGKRCWDTMSHLVSHADDFAKPVYFSVNMGFNPDGIPTGMRDGRPWAQILAQKYPVLTWDFSLTEGENGIFPHYRFRRLFEQRKKERDVNAYSGGICYTMTPLLNCLSLYAAGRSFMDPDADCDQVAAEFYERTFGPGAGEIAGYLELFEIVPEWGNHVTIDMPREKYHRRMAELAELVKSWKGRISGTLGIYPSAEFHRAELEYFAELFRDLSGDEPDFDALRKSYWNHVYEIYDHLPRHVDSRPDMATDRLMNFFKNWEKKEPGVSNDVIPGRWTND